MSQTQKIFGLARPRPGVGWEDMVPLMQTEAAHVWSLYERDVLRDAWMRTDALGAVYVLESTPDEAAGVLAGQPLARHGLFDFELLPVGPFTSLSLLFGTQPRPVAPAPPTTGGCGRVLAIGRLPAGTARDDLAPRLVDEVRHVWSLWKGGQLRENYLGTDRPEVALVLEAAGIAGAQAILAELPLVDAGLIEFECLALGAFVCLDALFEGAVDHIPPTLPDPTIATRVLSEPAIERNP